MLAKAYIADQMTQQTPWKRSLGQALARLSRHSHVAIPNPRDMTLWFHGVRL